MGMKHSNGSKHGRPAANFRKGGRGRSVYGQPQEHCFHQEEGPEGPSLEVKASQMACALAETKLARSLRPRTQDGVRVKGRA